MLLQILRAFERLAAKITSVRLQGYMDADVRSDMVTLDNRDVAVGPSTLQIKIVGALSTDVDFADMFLGEN